ncbi:MAG: SLBB domain-containing protein [Bdellovibrio sp.]|nr:SLBB domain-containing protein [Bdellovibrio sp.]
MNYLCKTHKLKQLALTLITLLFVACASKKERSEFPYEQQATHAGAQTENNTKNSTTTKLNKNDADPIVEPGFLYEISNLEDRTLSGRFRVDFDGQLKLPYNVKINTEHLKVSEVKMKIIQSFQKFFQTKSALTVSLAKREYLIEVRGLVEKPSRLVMTMGESLESVISRSGGLKADRERKEYEPRYLRLEKKDKTEVSVPLSDYFKNGSVPENFSIDGGDKLVFQVDAPTGKVAGGTNMNTIQVMGEIVRPGDLGYRAGADIYYYLQLAGGPTPGANLTDIRIVRGPTNNRVITQIDSLEEGKQPLLLPGDLILVPFEKPTKFERGVMVGSGFATILSAILLLFIVF